MRANRSVLNSVLIACLAGCSSGGSDGPRSTTIALTDDDSSHLSVLQVEITDVTVTDADGNMSTVFPLDPGETLVVDLLRLSDLHHLLGRIPVQSVSALTVVYQGATAVDKDGNLLTVTPDAGGATVMLDPPLQVAFLEVDIDVRNSLSNVVVGPGGSLDFSPTIIVRGRNGEFETDDFEVVVESVVERSMMVLFGAESLRVVVDDATVVQVGGVRVSGDDPLFNLAAYISPGDVVEIEGQYLVNSAEVLARSIEVEDEDEDEDRKLEGLVVDLSGVIDGVPDGSFDILVTKSNRPGVLPGSTETIVFDGLTEWWSQSLDVTASAANLHIGTLVRARESIAMPGTAWRIELRKVRVSGFITDVTGLVATMEEVSTLERLAVTAVPGLPAILKLNFSNSVPGHVVPGTTTKVEGFFVANDTLSVHPHPVRDKDRGGKDECEALLSGDYELPPVGTEAAGKFESKPRPDGMLHFELKVARIQAVTMAHIHLGGFGESGSPVVTLYDSSLTPQSFTEEEEIAEGVISDSDVSMVGDFGGTVELLLERMRAGQAYVNVHTLANPDGEIRGQIHCEDQTDEEDELSGRTYTVETEVPLRFTLTGELKTELGKRAASPSVVLHDDVVILLKDDMNTSALPEPDLIDGLNAGTYRKVKAEGTYDADTDTFTAAKVVAEL